MKKILSLYINLLLLIISDAVPLKLIAGDRSVVKKDGVTHTISKYYVVPNDFHPNNVTNSTEATQATLRMNHSLYSKSMDAEPTSEGQVNNINRAEAANDQNYENKADVNNVDKNLRLGLNDAQVDVATQADDNTAKSMGSVNTEQSLDPDDLGNLQVEPITNSIITNGSVPIDEIKVYNSSKALQNGTLLIVKNATQTFEIDVEDELDDLMLTKFGIAVQEKSIQNLESFWRIIKLTKDRISDDEELLAKIERFSVLLNIFTNLYEAAQLQKPIKSMIDSILDILQISFVGKTNRNESQYQTKISGDYVEECLRKCGQKRSKPQLDSNGTYLSETETLEASDNPGLDNLKLQRRQRGDSDHGDNWVNTSNDPGSNEVIVSNQPANILRSQLSVPNNLNVGVSDGFKVHSPIATPTFNHISRHNDVQEDLKSNQTIPGSSEIDIDERLDYQPLTIESGSTDDLPWHIEDKKKYHQPWAKHRTTYTLPWTIEDKGTIKEQKLPWKVENKADHIWTIESNDGYSPITLYQSMDPSVITHGGEIILHPKKSMTGTVQSVKHGLKRPYHIYTYVINPETSLNEISNSGNIVKEKSRQPYANLGTKLYGLSTSHGGNKIVYKNYPSPSYYESEFSLSKPSVDISRPSNSQLKHENHVTSIYDTSDEVNPSNILSGTTRDYNRPTYLVGHEPETNHRPALLQPNIQPSNSQTNPDDENYAPTVPEADSAPGVLHPNVPLSPFKSLTNPGNARPVFTASTSVSADTSNVNPDTGDTEHDLYNRNINLNFIQQTDFHPSLISKASSYSEYTNSQDDSNEPSPVYGGHTGKHPGMISTSSSSSAYTNFPDEYYKPVYSGQTQQRPDLIHSSASSNSEYKNSPHDYNEPSPVYGGHKGKHPDMISTSSSSSAFTNLPDEYYEPVFDGQTHHRPYLISSSASSNSEYTNSPHDYNEPSPVYGGLKGQHPGMMSTSSSSSAYTNLPYEYYEPVYGGQTHQRPDWIYSSASSNSEYKNFPDGFDEPVYELHTHRNPGSISSSASSNSEYINLADDYDESNHVYDGQTHKYPVFISKASAHSKYINLPNGYNNPIPDYGHDTDQHPGLISKIPHHYPDHYPEYANIVDDYNEQIPVYGGETHKHPNFISEASSHSKFTNVPNDYNNPTPDYEGDTDRHPNHIEIPVNGIPTEIEDNPLVSHQPYGQKVHIIQSSFIPHLHGNQQTGLNYLKYLKLKLAPTYRLFTFGNLLKLRDLVIKTIEVNGDEYDVYDNRALINLRKIIKLILILAEHLEEPEGSIKWYEKIFYNTQKNRHPLQMYVYNLIRQRWLHELMLVLYKNEFNFNILQNPRIFSFLGSWQFPNYVLNFMEAEDHSEHNLYFDTSEVFDQTFSTHHGLQDKFATHTYDDLLEKVPENLENYVTNHVIDSYKPPNAGIVLSIAGVEAEPDANAIVQILQKYLHYKSILEKQENIITRDNKAEMLKQISLFLREKGYSASTIVDLIQKLYNSVYSTESKGCQTHHTNFAKTMYDVILPVLRRSGR